MMGSPFSIHTYLHNTVDQWQLADRNNCTTMPLDHNYQPRTTHFMDNPKLVIGERHLEAVSQVTVTGLTGHHDLIEINPNPTCLASSKQWWNPFG